MKLIKTLPALVLASVWMMNASAQTVLKIGYTPAVTSHYGVGTQVLCDEIEKGTQGRYKCQIFPNGALGGEREMIEAVQLGTLDIVNTSTGPVGNFVPEVKIVDIPFLFRDYDHARRFLDGPIGQEILTKFPSKGLVALAWTENGFRHMTNSKRPIVKPEDMKGLKMRTPPDAVLVDIMQALGAEAQQIKFAELYVALQQGVVDGQENPLVNIHASKLYEVQKHLALTSHMFQMTPFLMSKRSWDKLGEADRKALHEAAAEATELQRKLSQEADDRLIADLKAKGVQINTVDKTPFAKATANVDDKWLATPIGPFLKKVIAASR